MRRALLLLLVVLAAAGCGGDGETASTRTDPTAGVRELENVLALRSDFVADAGRTRVILLLSPT